MRLASAVTTRASAVKEKGGLGMAALVRTPVLPEAVSVGALSTLGEVARRLANGRSGLSPPVRHLDMRLSPLPRKVLSFVPPVQEKDV